jgi:hypothetical protein
MPSSEMARPSAPATVPETSRSRDDGAGRGSTVVRHGLFGPVRRPRWRATVGALTVALFLAAICWYFGADPWHSILIGTAVTAVAVSGLVGIGDLNLGEIVWRGGGRPNRNGARSDIEELSWSLRGSRGRVNPEVMWRVRRLARQRLALHQLDLLDPADRGKIEQLIGHRANALLVRGDRRPPLRSLLRCLDVLDTLNPTGPATSSRSRRETPTLVPRRPGRARER